MSASVQPLGSVSEARRFGQVHLPVCHQVSPTPRSSPSSVCAFSASSTNSGMKYSAWLPHSLYMISVMPYAVYVVKGLASGFLCFVVVEGWAAGVGAALKLGTSAYRIEVVANVLQASFEILSKVSYVASAAGKFAGTYSADRPRLSLDCPKT